MNGVVSRFSITGNQLLQGERTTIVNGVVHSAVVPGEHVVLEGNDAVNTITMGTDVELDVDDIAQYVGLKTNWHWVMVADIASAVEADHIVSATQDAGTKYITATLSNTSIFPDDYPSRMPGWIMPCKKNDGTALSLPVVEGAILRVYIEIDGTALPDADALANIYVGVCNTAGVPSTSTSGSFLGWRRSGVATYVLATTKGTENAAASAVNRFVVAGDMVWSTYTPVMLAARALNPDGSWSDYTGTQQSATTPADTDYKLFIGLGLASSNNTPAGPHVVKFRAAYCWIQTSEYPGY